MAGALLLLSSMFGDKHMWEAEIETRHLYHKHEGGNNRG